ncbi:WD40/YVTN/BNR-like repeat-containing protein [Paraburkholderia sp.]|uniref:WD40/YVTN/BNR-like repeat-containing protein n=1 Tax=Paraburkholderia sp. TaxID=1926495 RepID=UPI003C7978FC
MASLALDAYAVTPPDGAVVKPELSVQQAEQTTSALSTAMLGAATAGTRIVSVGDHGAVLLSDDDGAHFRQAKRVPTSSSLTSVTFVNEKTGWAVGQWGVILRTDDGGDTWKLQRVDLANDRPLFSVYFKAASEGWAVGLWSLMLHTTNGGASWEAITLLPPPGSQKADINLNCVFADEKGELFVSAERGLVLKSEDDGKSWSYSNTGYAGSFWTGAALKDGTILVAGLRGSIYRSSDDGVTWHNVSSGLRSSVTGMFQRASGTVVGIALEGVSLVSNDNGKTFEGVQRSDRIPLTAVTESNDQKLLLFSDSGPVKQR